MSIDSAKSSQISSEEVLVGACELALLEAAWQYFLNRPTVSNYLFVIDAPTISKVHSLPPYNIAQFGLTSFLNAPDRPEDMRGKKPHEKLRFYAEQSQDYPLAVGLTEIVSRYLFDRRWSGDRPKLMSAVQLGTLGGILDGLERDASKEMSTTLRNIEKGNVLKDIIQRWQQSPGAEPHKFVDDVVADLEKALPTMYGTYNHTRQLLRLTGVLPLENETDESQEKLVFMHTYEEIDEILNFESIYWKNSSRKPLEEFNALVDVWHNEIAPPGVTNKSFKEHEIDEDDTDTRSENARVLAQIEFVNREFRRNKQDIRLVFVTTTGRLFDSAVKRFGCSAIGKSARFGPLSRFEKAYYIHQLLTEPTDSIKSDGSCLSDVPLFDPRILLCNPDFVSYAAYDKETKIDEQARSISKWLSLFFSNKLQGTIQENTKLLFSTYKHWQSRQPPKTARGVLDPYSDFSENAFGDVKENWSKYVRLVAAAGGLGRVIHHQMMHDIIVMLKANNNPALAFKDIVSDRLNKSMSDWLAATGRKAVYEWDQGQHFFEHSRSMPPFIMPVFNGAQEAFVNLAHINNSQKLPANTLNLLKDPDPMIIGFSAEDEHAMLKARYIQMLLLAAVFYKMSKWEAAHLLATQAYSLAEQVLCKGSQHGEGRFISGREAAYFTSVCLRRTSYSIRYAITLPTDGRAWCARYEHSAKDELNKECLSSERFSLHLIRSNIERITWDAIKVVALASQGEPPRSHVRHATDILRVSERLHIELIDINERLNRTDWDDLRSKACYEIASVYLNKQLALVQLQVSIFSPTCLPPEDQAQMLKEKAKFLRSLDVEDALSNGHGQQVRPGVEQLLLDVSDKILSNSRIYNIQPALNDSEPYTLWRDNALQNILAQLSA